MDINFNFVVDEDQLLAALESGATMDQVKEAFNAAVNKAAEKKLQKQREENEARIAKERDESLREALDYLLDWYDSFYGEFDYTIPHAIITPEVREHALEFARFIIDNYKVEDVKPKVDVSNKTTTCACNHPEAKKKSESNKEKISNSVADVKKKPDVKAYTYKFTDSKEIDKILETFFKNYNL